MQKLLSSPWVAVSLGIIGLVAGYTFVIAGDADAFAALECLVDGVDGVEDTL